MLTEARWQKEQELMAGVFPEFRPFTRGSRFGFEGHLKGSRSGQIYDVALDAEVATYPQLPPHVHMQPRIGLHWIGEGDHRRLCMEREWRPARSTFANTLLTVVRYLDQHDPDPEIVTSPSRGREGAPVPGGIETNTGRGPWAGLSSWLGRGF